MEPNQNEPKVNIERTVNNSPQEELPSSNSSRSRSRSGSCSSKLESHSNSSNSKRSDNEVEEKEIKKEESIDGGERRIRYKYCCKFCKHTDSSKSKKACVCVVPKDQRRTEIGDQGCQTCSCKGCSKEDFISRGEDPEYKPSDKAKPKKREKEVSEFEARNGCCRKCMKAFSKTNKSCLCQVPEDVRNTKLPSEGCKICGCFGCNPEDKKDPKHRKRKIIPKLEPVKKERERSRSRSRDKDRRKKLLRSRSYSESSKEHIDPVALNFYNFDKSTIGGMIMNEYRLDPALFGFTVPQRTYSYITGKPK